MVWKQGMSQWVAAGNVKGLFPDGGNAACLASPPPIQPAIRPPTATLVQQSAAVVPDPNAPVACAAPSSRTNERPCDWCTKEMPSNAVNCPHCGKLRKDIYNDKVLCYLFNAFGVLPASLLMQGLVQGWWNVKAERASQASHPVATNPALQAVELAARLHNQLFDKGEFNFGKFLSTPTGMVIFIGFGVCVVGATYYWAKASTKLGTWIWA
jgi:hypothetical protein